MSANTFTRCAWLLIFGFVSACGSSNDNAPVDTQETISADPTSSEDSANDSIEETGNETVESASGETEESAAQEATESSGEDSTEQTGVQNDAEETNTDSQQEPMDSEAEAAEIEPAIANNQRVSFGAAKLLVDLVPNDGGSYPAKFHRTGDKLSFITVDTDPRFAQCSWHWGALSDADKSISFNLLSTHAETGVVAMNKKIMTVGDFVDDPNDACAGYNGTIMRVFRQNWLTPRSTSEEQQFAIQFDSPVRGPDRLWTTDGSDANTSLLETGQAGEQVIFEGNKVFFMSTNDYSKKLEVSSTFSGDRRKLFEMDTQSYNGRIKQIEKSPARQAIFEIEVAWNRFQIWMYDLDTDEWVKKINIKPDTDTYVHIETLRVDEHTLLSRGESGSRRQSSLGLSSASGDITSFELLTNSEPTFADKAPPGSTRSNADNERVIYSTSDTSVEPRSTSIWRYSEQRTEKLFSFSEPNLRDMRVIDGYDGHIYVTGTRQLGTGTDYALSLDLWSYNLQTRQLVKVSNDDWYAIIYNHPISDEGYYFRYLNTPDGLVFVNLSRDSGRELWFTDGTSEGTRQLADINPGSGNSNPESYYYSEDAIYFSADDGTHGREPWMIPMSR